ncbi:MAG: response regulator [Methyloprofundus sp.]|nr:response regulator [Methyloprofundus sp.]MBW6453113.1 response regulator [Methyloprofundus sp.]
MNNIRPILLAEDDHVDVMTVRRAFKQLNVLNELIVAKNGEEVIGYLDDPQKPLPCLIILDINMPKMNGLECLKILKQRSVYKNIPVFMLSSSREQQDVDSSFARGIAGYILKPIEFDEFLCSIKVLNSHWTVGS